MNTEFKYTLIENESEYKIKILNEIENTKNESELLRLLSKLISVQYYKGLFHESDEYDEIISSKINELIESDEIKYIIKSYLDAYDIYLESVKYEIPEYYLESVKIKAIYIIDIIDSEIYLDELNESYLDEIIIYPNESDLEYYINELISCHLNRNLNDSYSEFKKNHEFIFNYFNYDEFISDMIDSDELIEYDINHKKSYIMNYNNL
jgi:hypothetical protein